jgi:hypothetical protein
MFVSRGYALIQAKPSESITNGVYSQQVREEWGVIVELGKPLLKDFPWYHRWMPLFFIHPAPFKKGATILIPSGQDIFIDGKQYRVIKQSAISVYSND